MPDGRGVNMHHISTTITKAFFDMKMQDLEWDGCFYEYKEDKPFWHKRMQKIPLGDCRGQICEPVEIVFLVGKVPHRFKVTYITYTSVIPERYASVIKTEYAYAIKCVVTCCARCGAETDKLYPVYHVHCHDDNPHEYDEQYCGKKIMVCWDCDWEITNGRGEPDKDPYEIANDRAEQAYADDPINNDPPWWMI